MRQTLHPLVTEVKLKIINVYVSSQYIITVLARMYSSIGL